MTRTIQILSTIAILAGSAIFPCTAETLKLGGAMPEFSLYDTSRRLRVSQDYTDSKAIAIVLGSTECPLVNLYLPALKELNTELQAQGVTLLMVNADPGDSFNRVGGHKWENQLNFAVLKDFDQSFAKSLGATRTPEVFLFDSKRSLVYKGRINDQYTVTHRSPSPKNQELKEALDQLLAGKAVSNPSTTATGCLIDYAENEFASDELTYNHDIAPIVAAKCMECHQKGRVGQISFANYRQLKRFSKTIREVVTEQRMPPWHADPHYGEFMNNRSLSDEEQDKLIAWIDKGCPKGEGELVIQQTINPEIEWAIGTPDLIVSMPHEEKVPASGVVDYRYITVDPGFKEDVWIQAAEARPGNAEVVHHVIAYIISPGKKVFDREGETAILVGWAPGDMPAEYAPGIARRITAGSKLRFELHYTPNGQATVDRSSVAIRFAKTPPTREIHTNIMWQRELSIPAGASWHEEASTYEFRDDARILSLMPHMHIRGVAAKYILRLPDGKSEMLLSVPNFDFNWQSVYRFKDPISVPKGAKLTVTGVWDNSTDNPSNPDAGRTIPWGEQTFDEMLNGWVDFVYEKEDHPREIAVTE
ncbi:redoxin domain-containing protein [Verrucomicrobia bacterium]|nr:redoxin domain-containing protein [Verrucomicrobiota bacterium]MDA7511162.1 redoxin domain-containing protein [Verrucomicrobiota bacterium]MDA7657324.1 redoxin domain-containing protein [Verrucomicrobiota bacterium]MDA7866537.1 redoxin domain-containing protein [Verrucomicrobiota bacterium]